MKLRNKKTGEIKEVADVIIENMNKNGSTLEAISIDEIKEEWEDVPEEPKEYWFIDYDGGIIPFSKMKETATDKMMKQIGNYFETKEEVEKAVEKLKAWKRLKDGGFKLKGWYMPKNTLNIEIDGGFPKDVSLCDVMDDLDIVSGGENELA